MTLRDDLDQQSRGALCEMLRAMGHGTHDDLSLAFEAADEIERLRADRDLWKYAAERLLSERRSDEQVTQVVGK